MNSFGIGYLDIPGRNGLCLFPNVNPSPKLCLRLQFWSDNITIIIEDHWEYQDSIQAH